MFHSIWLWAEGDVRQVFHFFSIKLRILCPKKEPPQLMRMYSIDVNKNYFENSNVRFGSVWLKKKYEDCLGTSFQDCLFSLIIKITLQAYSSRT